MAKYSVAVLICMLAFVSAEKVEFKSCTSEDGQMVELDVTPCPEQPCKLVKGKEAQLAVHFTPKVDIPKLTSKVHGILSGVPVPFPVPQSDECVDQGLDCPLKKGVTYTFKTTLPIKSIYPSIKLIVKWEAVDQNGKDVFCWTIPAEIVSG